MNMKLTILTTAALLTTSLSALHEALAPLQAKAENLQHTQQLLSTKQCPQCDLSGAGLVLANLEGANLSGADLSRANLSRTNLAGADLSGANLSGASLGGANLTGANLSGANIGGADLRDAVLFNAKLVGVNLNTAFVQGAIGIPQNAGTPEDFYSWGVAEAQRGNYQAAIAQFNQVLTLKSDFAPALLARGIALYKLGNEAGATQDVQSAGVLFTTQGNTQGYQASQNFIKAIEIARNPPKSGGGPSIGDAIVGISSLLLRIIAPF
jgi:uncharacterized protein YjbI with pentapeptide repeats